MTFHKIEELEKQEEEKKKAKAKKAGRPRSVEAKQAILEATRRLLTFTPVQKLSIEAIAKKAGVGKTTIYRWWPNKTAVIMEAVFSQAHFNNVMPTPRSATDGIRNQISKLVKQLNGKHGHIVAEILGDAQSDTKLIKMFVETFLQSKYDTLDTLLREGKTNGEFKPDLDVDAAIDLILGSIFFRLLSGQEVNDEFEKKLITLVLRAL